MFNYQILWVRIRVEVLGVVNSSSSFSVQRQSSVFRRIAGIDDTDTVVPVMNGHPLDQAKVSVHCRWPLVTGTDEQAGDAKHNTPCYNTITTNDIPNEYTHCHNHQTTARKFERSVGRKFGCAPVIFG